MEQIERSKTNELWRLIYGLGIRHIGERARAGAGASLRVDRGARRRRRIEQLQETQEIGPVLAESVRSVAGRAAQPGVARPGLAAAGVRMEVPESERAAGCYGAGPLAGRTYVITGTLATMTREEAEAALEAAGCQSRGVGQQEDHGVIVGSDAGSKAEKARDTGRADAGRGDISGPHPSRRR